jgi:Kdo2-lipid IVA lauroyltransferase/acyltransferase
MEEQQLTLWKTIRYGAEAAGFFLLMGFFKLLGLDAASHVGGFIGRYIFIMLPPSRIARDNLRATFPDKSDAEINAIVRAMWDNLGRVTAEYPHLGKLTLHDRIEMVGTEYGNTAIAAKKGVMFVSGHFANWETMPCAGQQLGYDGAIVQRPPNNPFVARWIEKQRALLGPQEMINKGPKGTRRIFTRLRKGKSVFLLADQKTNQGVPVVFFGRPAMTTPAPAALALKLGSVLLPVSAERTKGAHFRVHIRPPLNFTPGGDYDADVLALTGEITRVIEGMVRERPAQWLWIHRRWPSERDKRTIPALQPDGGRSVRADSDGSSLV